MFLSVRGIEYYCSEWIEVSNCLIKSCSDLSFINPKSPV